jgi:argininosuccinate lyase
MPFREAHGVVGGLVRHALDRGVRPSELSRDELASFSELLDDEYYEVLSTERSLESKLSHGGTASSRVRDQLEAARRTLSGLEAASG